MEERGALKAASLEGLMGVMVTMVEALQAPESFTDLWVVHRDAAQVESDENNTAARPHEGSAATTQHWLSTCTYSKSTHLHMHVNLFILHVPIDL